jgi:hypothetical protein
MEICGIQEFEKVIKNSLPELNDSLKFKTNKILLSNQKIYNSRACQLEDIPCSALNEEIPVSKIKDKSAILLDLSNCFIFE